MERKGEGGVARRVGEGNIERGRRNDGERGVEDVVQARKKESLENYL